MSDSPATSDSTLDAKSFHILAVVARQPLHGYAIRQEVEAATGGAVRLWPATLYGSLAALAASGLLTETTSPAGADDDPRRRYYAITPAGRKALRAEADRLGALAQWAHGQLTIGEGGR